MPKTKKNPNTAWKNEGAKTAEQINSGNTSEMDYTVETLVSAKKNLRTQWAKKKERFTKAWGEMTPESREDLIRAISPFTPKSPQETTLIVNGKEEDVSGACVLLPHLCISELVPGNKLIDQLDARNDPARDDLDWIYLDYDFVKSLVAVGVVNGTLDKLDKKFVFLQPDEKFGHTFDMKEKTPPKEIQEWFDKEIIINADVFTSLFHLQQSTYTLLGSIIAELFDKHGTMIARLSGCNKCGHMTWKEDATKDLKFCPCKRVGYCSKECQASDWSTHKPDHKVA